MLPDRTMTEHIILIIIIIIIIVVDSRTNV